MKNLHKYIVTASVAGSLLLSAGFVFADDTSALDALNRGAEERAQKATEQIQKLRDQALVKVRQQREDLRKKIGQISDQKKREAASKITNQLEHINQIWTNHFVNVLDRLDMVLQKVKSRTQKAAANGSNVSSVNSAITKAETAIATARTAVATQAQKTYVATVSQGTSTNVDQNGLMGELRKKFKDLRDQLFKDLTTLRDGAIKDARVAVKDALQALSKVPNVDQEPASNSNNQ